MKKSIFESDDISVKQLSVMILFAYAFSFAVRMIWVNWAGENPDFMWHGQLMINTNDGYYFASAAEYLLNGMHAENLRVPSAAENFPGLPYLTFLLAKYTPFSLDTIILYLPAVVSSLIVIPIILTGKLLKLPQVGFFAALLGSIAWSYYNRTMIGYYDTDMFSVFLMFVILYLFLLTIYIKKDTHILWLSFSFFVYELFYPEGLSILYAIFIFWSAYQLFFQKEEKSGYVFIIIASVALWTVSIWIKIVLVTGAFFILRGLKEKLDRKQLLYLSLFAVLLFLSIANVFGLILSRAGSYLNRGVNEHGLHFYQVIQTVREAGKISWETVANRIIGHPVLLLLSLAGYILLVLRHKAFIIALPLIGIGVFAHWAGLRFTVYAVPVAAFSLIYLFYFLSGYIKNKKNAFSLFVVLSLLALYPNISHIRGYKVPTVLNKTEVKDLDKLNQISNPKDYTISWWDYGYPIWYYSDTATLIDGGKHHNDNFVISKIMQTSSSDLAANLSRLAVETYAESIQSYVNYKKNGEKEEDIPSHFKMLDKNGEVYHAGRGAAIDILLKNGQKDQIDPDLFLEELKSSSYVLPKKTRDIYLYLPYRMMRIFPTVAVFGNLDLKTGEEKHRMAFYPSSIVSSKNGIIQLGNGIVFDTKKGNIRIGKQKKDVKYFIITQNTKEGNIILQSQRYHANGDYIVIYMKSYGQMIVMDTKTFHSTYVQMFILGKYDKDLFELVVSSPYSRIYKLKK